MNCPKEIEDILLDLIYMATIRIRAAASNENARQCGIEASHIHNLPDTLKNYSEDRLMHYYRIDMRTFVTESEGVNISSFQPLWNKLAKYIELKRLDI